MDLLCLQWLYVSTECYHCTDTQVRSQDFSKGGAEIMEAKVMKRKNGLW